jgi:hypothetical protein
VAYAVWTMPDIDDLTYVDSDPNNPVAYSLRKGEKEKRVSSRHSYTMSTIVMILKTQLVINGLASPKMSLTNSVVTLSTQDGSQH